MTANNPGARLLRTAGALLVVGILGILATRAPLPPAPDLAWGQQADEPSDEVGIDRDTKGFTFTPYDVKPRCLSGCDEEDLVRHFQAVEDGECRVTIGIRIDRDGRVLDTEMLRRAVPLSCQTSADAWARGTAWSPAFRKGEKVVAWIAQPVTYAARAEGASDVAPEDLPERSIAPVDTPPRFERTAFDERPVCVENCQADAILSALKEAGPVAGHCEAVIGIRIDAAGTVTATDLLRTEGECLDTGLRRWAESTRWKPARRNGEPVIVWIAQPVTTSVDPRAEEPDGEGARPLEPQSDPDAIAKTALRRAMTAQEAYRAEHGKYADAFELGLSPPETITFELRSDDEGYGMIARHDHGTAYFCASSETRAIVEGTDC